MSPKLKKIKSNQLRRYREKRSLRKGDMAKLLGVSQANDYYGWENGQRLPTLINALKLSAMLKCPLEILFMDHYKQIQAEMYENPQS